MLKLDEKILRRFLLILLAVFVLSEVLLLLFNPFTFLETVRGLELATWAHLLLLKVILVLIVGTALLLFMPNRQASNFISRLNLRHLTAAILIFAFVFILMAFLDYLSFNVPPPDMWIFNQSMWNTVHGNFMQNSWYDGSYFANHFALVLLLLLPAYALFQSPLTLLFIQNIFLALAALPIFLIAKQILKNQGVAIAVSLTYLLFPAMEFIALREFHPVALAIPFLLFAFYFLINNRHKAFFAFFALSMICKETVSLALFMLGLYTFFFMKKRKLGALCAVLAAAWFFFTIFVAVPYFNQGPYPYLVESEGHYSYLGSNLSEILQTIVFNPLFVLQNVITVQKMGYLLLLLLPVALLSLVELPILLIALPFFMQNLLSSSPVLATIYFQYNATIIPFVFISAIYGFKKLTSRFNLNYSVLAVVLLSIAILSNVFFSPSPLSAIDPAPLRTNFSLEKYSLTNHDIVLWDAITLIPGDAEISTEALLLAQLSTRANLEYFPMNIDTADYILLDTTEQAHASATTAINEVEQLKQSNEFELLVDESGVLLFKRTSP